MKPLPFAPPEVAYFDLFFFRQVFEKLKAGRQDVASVPLRHLSFKIQEAMDIGDPFEINFFGHLQKKRCKWPDVRDALTKVGHPEIKLTLPERIFLALEDHESCKLARAWFNFIMLVTLVNLLGIIAPDYAEHTCEMLDSNWDGAACKHWVKWFCCMVFTFEYVAKLALSPFVRIEVIIPDSIRNLLSDQCVVSRRSKLQRLSYHLSQTFNIIDFIAILPFWLTLVFGHILPSTSFLRVIRMARLFRIFKTARYLDMLQVLGRTLWKSTSMVAILCALISIIALIIGCLLSQVEQDNPSPVFSSVPAATYWISARMISMKEDPSPFLAQRRTQRE